MNHRQIAGNQRLNEFIDFCLEHVCEEDARRFVAKLRKPSSEPDSTMHTVTELAVGAYLGLSGFTARHDWRLDTKRPDWCIRDAFLTPIGLVEATTLHIDKTTEEDIEKHRRSRLVISYWRDANRDNVYRLYQAIQKKARKYKQQVEALGLAYVVAVFGDYRLALDLEEIRGCLIGGDAGLFTLYPHLSGVLFVEEIAGRYLFQYTANSEALRALHIPGGVFPP